MPRKCSGETRTAPPGQEEAAAAGDADASAQGGKKTGTDDSTVVDAEFEEVDPDKKRQ